MSGKCYSCASDFGFFKKELGCKNCGFSFCKDCLQHKVAVPKHNNQVLKVCNKCHDILTGKVDPATQKRSYSPPDAHKKRMAALNDAPAKPKRSTTPTTKKPYYPSSMTSQDIAIAQRLDKLKEGRKAVENIPDEKEIRERLNTVQKPVSSSTSHNTIESQDAGDQVTSGASTSSTLSDQSTESVPKNKSDNSSNRDELYKLMAQYTELVHIDQKYNTDQTPNDSESSVPTKISSHEDPLLNAIRDITGKQKADPNNALLETEELARLIEAATKEAMLEETAAVVGDAKDTELKSRLKKLQGSSIDKTEGTKDTAEDDEEESVEVAAERALKEILERTKLERNVSSPGGNSVENLMDQLEDAPDSDPEDQLPWCCICNNDAALRCYGCDGDLYCDRCYREGHIREGFGDHETKKFIPLTTSPHVQ